MNISSRKKSILTILRTSPAITIGEIAEEFSVSPVTVRRDLEKLEQEGLVTRTRGGATLRSQSEVAPALKRFEINIDGKMRIAEKAASMIETGSTVILDAGTTTGSLTSFLEDKKNLTIITPSLYIAYTLTNTDLTVMMPGGLMINEQMVLIGPECERYFKNVEVDMSFMAATGISERQGFTIMSPLQYNIKRAMLHSGRKKVALVDHMKFERPGFYLFANFEEIDCIITDEEIYNKTILQRLDESGVDIIVA